MSYLDTPRLVFSGQFQADPSTVNNDPEHFDTANFQTAYDLPGTSITFPTPPQQGMSNGWWNPTGSGAWRFRDCVVRQVVYRDGTSTSDPKKDPIIGMPVNDVSAQIEGKLVDLDSQQQMVSQIWGFKVTVGQTSSGGGVGFSSDFKVSPFADIWFRIPVPPGTPDSCFGAFYQGVLNVTRWAGPGGSRFLKELAAGGKQPKQLSIRFNVDAYNDGWDSLDFTFGRVVGSIGPYDPSEPEHFVAGRALQGVVPPTTSPSPSPFNTARAYAQLVGNVLTLDLGNSIPYQSVGGPPVDLGKLSVALLGAAGEPVTLGSIPYKDAGWYEQTAGIVSFKLTSSQAKQAANLPLNVIQDGQRTPLLAESADGMWVRADDFVFRLSPGESVQTTFYATRFGKRAPGQQISLAYDPSQMQGQATQGPLPGPQNIGTPESAFTFKTSLKTGSDGTVKLKLTAGDPGNQRQYIDGQLYGVTYGPGPTAPAQGSVQNPSQILNALVFSGYTAPPQPDWAHDVQPIFKQFANLYPVMQRILDLSDYDSVVASKGAIQGVFKTPVTSTGYMPVTRDLSPARRNMILSWLAQTPPLKSRGE
jgi:hypothetical protein